MLKSVRIRKGTTVSNTGNIQRKSTRNSPPIPRRNFRSFARDAHRVEVLEEEVRKEANCTKTSVNFSKRQRSCSAPSRK